MAWIMCLEQSPLKSVLAKEQLEKNQFLNYCQ